MCNPISFHSSLSLSKSSVFTVKTQMPGFPTVIPFYQNGRVLGHQVGPLLPSVYLPITALNMNYLVSYNK